MKGHTYFPKAGVFVNGADDNPYFVNGMALLAKARQGAPTLNEFGEISAVGKWVTGALSASVQKAAKMAASLKQQYMQTGALVAADEELVGDFLSPLIQIRLHQQIMGEMQRWFHLEQAFTKITVDQLLYRMPFQDNPAAAQKVPARQQYDINKVNYYEQFLELEKAVNSYDIAWEDKLRATIDFEPTLAANLNFSIDYLREIDAKNEIIKIKENKNKPYLDPQSGDFEASPTGTPGTGVSLNPRDLGAEGFHSAERSADLIMHGLNKYTMENDMHIDTTITHPKVGMAIAANTWTEPNTIMNVEAYRTNGGVRPFPGIPGVSMIMSLAMPEDELYFVCKQNNALILAEGPKQMKEWDDPTRFRRVMATADFYKHKYMMDEKTLKMPAGQKKLERKWAFWTHVSGLE